jgi:hypothetical protein
VDPRLKRAVLLPHKRRSFPRAPCGLPVVSALSLPRLPGLPKRARNLVSTPSESRCMAHGLCQSLSTPSTEAHGSRNNEVGPRDSRLAQDGEQSDISFLFYKSRSSPVLGLLGWSWVFLQDGAINDSGILDSTFTPEQSSDDAVQALLLPAIMTMPSRIPPPLPVLAAQPDRHSWRPQEEVIAPLPPMMLHSASHWHCRGQNHECHDGSRHYEPWV